MKKLIISLLVLFVGFVSCSKEEKEDQGQLSFASNYHTIDADVKVSVYIDGKYVGDIAKPSENIKKCGIIGNVTEDLNIGTHSYTYKVIIKSIPKEEGEPIIETEVTEKRTVEIRKDKCKKVFIDVSDMYPEEEE